MSANRWRTIFISDVHLGARASHPERLCAWLERNTCETLFIVGDLFDNVTAAPSPTTLKVLAQIARYPHIIYIPGNHDSLFRNVHRNFGRLEICREAQHATADGRRFLVMHGDEFDARIPISVEAFGVALDALARRIVVITGSKTIERAVEASVRAVARAVRGRHFERRLSEIARSMGLAGVITGHFHDPAIRVLDGGVLHVDVGDWVSHCTAIVEEHDGALRLIEAAPLDTSRAKIAR